ncbi:MAG: UDP-glucose 4-epimerase GalE [Pseudomonadota bacterium]
MATILVTGGAGYIGAHACKALAEAGHHPVAYDNLCAGWRDAVRFGPLEEGDVRDATRLTAVLRAHKPDAVLHFAALIEVGASVQDPAAYWSTNVIGSKTLLDAMVATGTPKLVFSSTCAVHGTQDGVTLDESAGFAPDSPYGATKAAVEMMIANYRRAYGLRAVALRYFNVAGADPEAEIGEQHRPETHLIPRAILAQQGAAPPLEVFGTDYPTRDGTCIRDYVHVSDLVAAHLGALAHLDTQSPSHAFALGTGTGLTVREILQGIEQATGTPVPHHIAPRRPGDPSALVCGSAKAQDLLNWNPKRSTIAHIIEDALTWHQGPGFSR